MNGTSVLTPAEQARAAELEQSAIAETREAFERVPELAERFHAAGYFSVGRMVYYRAPQPIAAPNKPQPGEG